jgi:hypothetical protein
VAQEPSLRNYTNEMDNYKSCRSMMKKKGRKGVSRKSSQNDESMEGSVPAVPAEPGTLKVVMFTYSREVAQDYHLFLLKLQICFKTFPLHEPDVLCNFA